MSTIKYKLTFWPLVAPSLEIHTAAAGQLVPRIEELIEIHSGTAVHKLSYYALL